jgi:hypothetical protein
MTMNRVLLGLALCAAVVGCSGDGGKPGSAEGPEAAVQTFYDHLNAGRYPQAMALYSAEARRALQDPTTGSDSGFSTWAVQETKRGTVDHVRVIETTMAEPTATVTYEVVYGDGSRASRSVKLTKESGDWRLGFVG